MDRESFDDKRDIKGLKIKIEEKNCIVGDLSLFIFGYWVNRYEVIFGRMQKADRQRKLVLGE